MTQHHSHSLRSGASEVRLPSGAVGIDAGMTLTKIARAAVRGAVFEAYETARGDAHASLRATDGATIGVTGALIDHALQQPAAVHVQEIEAAASGASALLAADGRLGTGEFVLALLGTGTAFAAVREGKATHLGGTALGGGSFAGIARRIDPSLSYEAMITGAERGDRRRVDTLISDVYPEGIGRVGPNLTAAHLAHVQDGSLDDVLAGLLNLHGENIAQIAASRAVVAKISRIVLAGGFAHNNPSLITSITSMTRLFGIEAELAPSPGFAGALGAALIAAESTLSAADG